MEWNPITGQYEEPEDDLSQKFESASDNDVMTAFGKPKKNVKKSQPQQGTPLLPKGGEYGRKGGNFYATLTPPTEPRDGAYGGPSIPKGSGSLGSRERKAKSQPNTDGRNRKRGMGGSNNG